MAEDEVLVRRIRRGETEAFGELYRRYEKRLFGYIRRHVRAREQAEDLFQEVFLSVLRDRRFELRPGRFGGWLFTVARNACLTHVRDTRRRAVKQEAVKHSLGPEVATPEQQLVRKQQTEAFRAALSELPPPQQETLMLKQVANLTYGQIAQVLGVPEGTVKSRLHQAVRGLQRRLATEGGTT